MFSFVAVFIANVKDQDWFIPKTALILTRPKILQDHDILLRLLVLLLTFGPP
jgi:hypothetical protein